MITSLRILSIVCITLCFSTTLHAQRSNTLFDQNWKFNRGDVTGAENESFNDQKWRTLDLPHDWSIEDLPGQSAKDSIIGPFSKKSIGTTATGYVVGGTAWYRKHFTLQNNKDQKVTIYFDGVYMNSDVWINGHFLGNHPYGYTGFAYDLTPYLKSAGLQNIIAVRVKNEGKNSRWYSGSGIYRHVWLAKTSTLRIQQWGVYITTPKVSAEKATVNIKTAIVNDGTENKVALRTRIIDKNGNTIASAIQNISVKSSDTSETAQTLTISKPALWSPEKPYLYRAVTEIINGKALDAVTTNFGARSIEYSVEKGFLLNGKRTLLKGGCMHNDNGPLGSATFDRAEERRIELLKSFGYNAVRTSHNPPSEQFLDACDRLGILVLDEAFDQWQRPKNPDDYHLYFDKWWKQDLASMILRDRNHPAIIMWSIGNEINERADSSGLVIAKKLVDESHKLDPSRPVTQAICDFWDHQGYKWDTTATAFKQMDIGSYNYMWGKYESDHQKYPDRIMLGTESYPIHALENWDMVEKHPWVLGDFVWTAMDYMGETGIGHTEPDKQTTFAMLWPWFNAYCGDIDLIGGKKPQSWYRDVVWRRTKMAVLVHAPVAEGHKEAVSGWGWPDEYPSWNFKGQEDKPLQVNVYSRGFDKIVLTLNGKTIDQENVGKGITTTFIVKYQAGVLKAIGLNQGKRADSVTLRTTGKPYQIRLVTDRKKIKANINDLCYVTVEVLDATGNVIPDADIPVHFTVSGNGKIKATGNANPKDMASFEQPVRSTFRGRCLVIIQPTGKAGNSVLVARAEGLKDGKATITIN